MNDIKDIIYNKGITIKGEELSRYNTNAIQPLQTFRLSRRKEIDPMSFFVKTTDEKYSTIIDYYSAYYEYLTSDRLYSKKASEIIKDISSIAIEYFNKIDEKAIETDQGPVKQLNSLCGVRLNTEPAIPEEWEYKFLTITPALEEFKLEITEVGLIPIKFFDEYRKEVKKFIDNLENTNLKYSKTLIDKITNDNNIDSNIERLGKRLIETKGTEDYNDYRRLNSTVMVDLITRVSRNLSILDRYYLDPIQTGFKIYLQTCIQHYEYILKESIK